MDIVKQSKKNIAKYGLVSAAVLGGAMALGTTANAKADSIYTVKSGDTYSQIAANHKVSLQKLEAANPSQKNPNLIFVNQKVDIPDANGLHTVQYVVRSGDTLSQLAQTFHTTVAVIEQENHLSSDLIYAGQVLTVHTDIVGQPVATQPVRQSSTTPVAHPVATPAAQQQPQRVVQSAAPVHPATATPQRVATPVTSTIQTVKAVTPTVATQPQQSAAPVAQQQSVARPVAQAQPTQAQSTAAQSSTATATSQSVTNTAAQQQSKSTTPAAQPQQRSQLQQRARTVNFAVLPQQQASQQNNGAQAQSTVARPAAQVRSAVQPQQAVQPAAQQSQAASAQQNTQQHAAAVQQSTQQTRPVQQTQQPQRQAAAQPAQTQQQAPAQSAAHTGGVVQYAESYRGVPYVWGGTTPNGFDCSGFTQYVYAHEGRQIGRTTYDQCKIGPHAPVNTAQPGDLLFWGSDAAPYHVGIYVGNGQYIAAPEPGETVSVAQMKYFEPSYTIHM